MSVCCVVVYLIVIVIVLFGSIKIFGAVLLMFCLHCLPGTLCSRGLLQLFVIGEQWYVWCSVLVMVVVEC